MNTEKLLDFKDIVNYLDSDGNSLLLSAIKKNDKAMIKRLIDLGANLNQMNHYGQCPLTEAYKLKDKYLIDKFFPQYQDSFSEESKNALLAILTKEDKEKYTQLYPINNNELAIFTSLSKGFLDEVKVLLEKGVNPNTRNKEGDPLLSTIRYWSATQKLSVLKLFVGYPVDFNLKSRWDANVLVDLVSSRKNTKTLSDKKIIPFIIKNFGIKDFTVSQNYQRAFLAYPTTPDDFDKYFLNHITEKNYKKINPYFLTHYDKEEELKKFLEKIEKNNWSIDYNVENKPFIYHFFNSRFDFNNKLGKIATKLSEKLDLNESYNKSEPLCFSLLLKRFDFDVSQVDVEKVDSMGNQILSLFASDLGGATLLSKNNIHYSEKYFKEILNNPKSDIYHENKEGVSFISTIIKMLSENKFNNYVVLRDDERANLKKILKESFKVKSYDSSYLINKVPLEHYLKSIFSPKTILLIEKNNLDKMIEVPNKPITKIKI